MKTGENGTQHAYLRLLRGPARSFVNNGEHPDLGVIELFSTQVCIGGHRIQP